MPVTPIILAAGRSLRMGRPKALLDLHGELCVARVLRACAEGGAGTPVVVLGHEAEALQAVLPPEVRSCMNFEFASTGPAASLQHGLDALPGDSDAFLLYPVDFPLVTGREVGALLTRWKAVRGQRQIVVPSHGMRRGHPALFHRSLVPEFRELDGNAPLHQILRAHQNEVEYVIMEDPWVLENMDTPEDYRRCLRIIEQRQGDAP